MKARIARLFYRFSSAQLSVFKRLSTPLKVQDFLDHELDYNDDPAVTCFSPLGVLKARRAHCIEGAMLAAAAFLFHGRRPLLLDLRADPTDDDHVIAPFREKNRWGAVAQSNFCGLRFREPIYNSVAELARSYFEFYYNERGKKTLREFSGAFDAGALPPEWLYGTDAAFVGVILDDARHYRILDARQEKKLRRPDSLLFEAELQGAGKKPLTRRRPLPYSRLI
jgi:hypothetical protein